MTSSDAECVRKVTSSDAECVRKWPLVMQSVRERWPIMMQSVWERWPLVMQSVRERWPLVMQSVWEWQLLFIYSWFLLIIQTWFWIQFKLAQTSFYSLFKTIFTELITDNINYFRLNCFRITFDRILVLFWRNSWHNDQNIFILFI